MGGCCYSCLKFLVIIFNLIYMLLGMALLGTALWIYSNDNVLVPVTSEMESYNHVLYFLMVVAAVMTIMGFIGCCGAHQESQCMLATFFALVLVLVIGQVAAGVWVQQNQEQFKETVEKSVARSIQYDYGVNEIKTDAFDVMQSQLECCGATGPSDWAEARYNKPEAKSAPEVGIGKLIGLYTVPESCCRPSGSALGVCDTTVAVSLASILPGSVSAIYTEGCTEKMLELIAKYDFVVLAVVLAILLTEAMAMIFSMVLCCAVRRIDHFKA